VQNLNSSEFEFEIVAKKRFSFCIVTRGLYKKDCDVTNSQCSFAPYDNYNNMMVCCAFRSFHSGPNCSSLRNNNNYYYKK